MNVTIVGANGEIGLSTIAALTSSPTKFVSFPLFCSFSLLMLMTCQNLTAIVRPASINKPEIEQIRQMGVSVVPVNLENNHDELVKTLAGQDVVVSAVVPLSPAPEIALANAAKEAGVKRFVPSAFGPSCPPSGIMLLRDIVSNLGSIILPS